jgi:hypothetical protein
MTIEKSALEMSTIPLLLGGAAAGVAVYDTIRSELFPTMTLEDVAGDKKERVKSRAWALQTLKKKPLRKPPVIVTTEQDLAKLLTKVKIPRDKKQAFMLMARGIIRHSLNALAVRVGDVDILVLPEKAAKATIEHEIGHLRDIEAGKDTGKGGKLSRIAQLFWKPEYKKRILDPEERAWKYVRGRKGVKERSVGTYQTGFHRRRAELAGKAALTGAGAYGLLHLIKRLRRGK